ncbi:Nudix family hydrolase [Alkalilimnicola sp. S0819]|uniref:Nudix family hydrolase n=1 Tax=Alkalilimnicola sp. S0819 TaxID=2613922 RepID=UPI0012626D17|nr:Nudix family hydrolase [Alkalilimnicola sp. S0819]KAB7623129.1 Nudix family hydrolase [Alkalilimnicola sp. S0819]MPQ16973.1 Nudix family hydrolase [Alkalilimnicola sp. S0819]
MPTLHVAAAAIFDSLGRVLIARRSAHRHQGGLWEFPGGKIEPGESVQQALCRELEEELGIRPLDARPLIRIPHRYPDREVVLHVRAVRRWHGEPRGLEGQPLRWVTASELNDYDFPTANRPIVRAVQLPDQYLITPDPAEVPAFEQQLDAALRRGVRLLQLRAPSLGDAAYARLAERLLPRVHELGGKLLLNADPALCLSLGADGVHLNARRLAAARQRPLPSGYRVAVSCHDASQLARAAALDADFAVLSPVCATASHPGVEPMGWESFAALVADAALPVYALGGLSPADTARAREAGGQGIAAIRGLWSRS